MLVRTIIGFSLLFPFLAILYLAPAWVLPCAYFIICAAVQYELLSATGILKHKSLLTLSVVAAASVPFFLYFEADALTSIGALLVFISAVFFIAMRSSSKIPSSTLTFTAFGLLTSFFLSMIIPIRTGDNGIFLLLLPFISAWGSDTGAYFMGTLFGKHKLWPKISPKKSVEGAFGGVFFASLLGFIYATLLTAYASYNAKAFLFALVCALGSIFGQFSDLLFSFIKREHNIKDYGNIFPGHGGMLDRVDSLVLSTPAVYILLVLTQSL